MPKRYGNYIRHHYYAAVTYIDNLISDYYDKTYIDDLDTELSTILINTYTKQEIDDNHYTSTYIDSFYR